MLTIRTVCPGSGAADKGRLSADKAGDEAGGQAGMRIAI